MHDGGQFRVGKSTECDPIEANDRNILGHAQAKRAQRMQSAGSHAVIVHE